MITIWKLENDSWSFVSEFSGSLEDLSTHLIALREDGSEYRAEKSIGGLSSILEV